MAAGSVAERAAVHRALGDPTRLALVDRLQLGDRSPSDLCRALAIPTNLLAFHLDILEEVGLVERLHSEGDGRRRYVRLRHRPAVGAPPAAAALSAERVLFVCTANSARSQLAAHAWRARTGRPAYSAGTRPATRVDPAAVAVAARRGLDLHGARPMHLEQLTCDPDLVVSVCDRAHETATGHHVPELHWSVPDPVGGGLGDFERTLDDLERRIEVLACAVGAGRPSPATPRPSPATPDPR